METTMAAGGTFSVRLPPETKRELEEYAKATKRSSAFIVKEAVEAHLAERRAYLEAIEEGEREADLGVFVSGEAVFKWMESWGTDKELPRPEPDVFPANDGKS
jgi:predicted transcriptional regulator